MEPANPFLRPRLFLFERRFTESGIRKYIELLDQHRLQLKRTMRGNIKSQDTDKMDESTAAVWFFFKLSFGLNCLAFVIFLFECAETFCPRKLLDLCPWWKQYLHIDLFISYQVTTLIHPLECITFLQKFITFQPDTNTKSHVIYSKCIQMIQIMIHILQPIVETLLKNTNISNLIEWFAILFSQ